ncbi:TIGR02594, TIGR02594 family protein [uncultured Caudovirales phage]|uniref:TIGR02594, TIGR02594 family protein n=1 Tax=uncultured Caudovirales phage TaxID=2100421 RepID=A0A6J5Q595_9CAUD|nr:TIGR02594, TIGR02594 family protein [uncultured Caudovirales phage]
MLKSFSEFIGEATISATTSDAKSLVDILKKYIGKKEEGNNAGTMVKGFLKSVGLGVGNPWCMAFVYAIFKELCDSKGIKSPLHQTASVLNFWYESMKKSPDSCIKVKDAIADPTLVKPGQIFIKSRLGGGHTGIVIKVEGDSFVSIDGNSSDQVKLNRYKIANMLGFVDHFKNPQISNSIASLASSMTSSSTPTLGGGKEV